MTKSTVFISYNHKDEKWKDRLVTHLGVLKMEGLLDMWDDRRIEAGEDWQQEIKKAMSSARVAILLISADFLSSNFIMGEEVPNLLECREKEGLRIFPVIIRPSAWKYVKWLARMNLRPKDGKPITSGNENQIETELAMIAEEIADIMESSSLKVQPETLKALEFRIEHGDITLYDADVIALKYAQRFYGADKEVAYALNKARVAMEELCPIEGDHRYVRTNGSIHANYALFIGVHQLSQFGYQEIREFAKDVLKILSIVAPNTKHLAMTIHGPGFGLDEVEAFLAQFAGYLDVIHEGKLPTALQVISIVDINNDRVQRLRRVLEKNIADASYASRVDSRWAYRLSIPQLVVHQGKIPKIKKAVEMAGKGSESKPHVFVAMPFRKDMDDVFYYGIQAPAHANDLLCERVDQEAFTGDIIDRVKKRIETAAVVIAELSGANPNVYLEIGYAWGRGRPTILLVRDSKELHFDVSGQRCLTYERIKDLEEILTKELKELRSKGLI